MICKLSVDIRIFSFAASSFVYNTFMYTVNNYCRDLFGGKIYKIALNGGFTCPNRDGKCGNRGCIFCSAGGSGDFAPDHTVPVDEQIEDAKKIVAAKYKGSKYIAYFQAFTNTYAPADKLRELYFPVIKRADIAALSIATRPDCLEPNVLEVLDELNHIKPVWVELGLQTIHEKTAQYIRRGYPLSVYDEAIRNLNSIGIHVITHVILGLPGENEEDMLATVNHCINAGTGGIKLQLLHVLEGTDLAEDYRKGLFEVLTFEEYIRLITECVKIIPENVVIHRLTGDGPKRLLIAPKWSGDKKRVLNALKKHLGAVFS